MSARGAAPPGPPAAHRSTGAQTLGDILDRRARAAAEGQYQPYPRTKAAWSRMDTTADGQAPHARGDGPSPPPARGDQRDEGASAAVEQLIERFSARYDADLQPGPE